MFCNNCKSARPDNEAPCPTCGAPSSLPGQYQMGGWGTAGPVATSWNASATSFNQQWNNQGAQFPADQGWSQNPGFQNLPMPQQSAWSFAGPPPGQAQQEQGPPSLLPVPYTGNAQEGNQQGQMQLVPFQQQMLPAIPDEQAEAVYVPPMYTKPRPIIPRYRIFSGIMSVLIVSLLLCGGGIYYGQTNGMFTNVERMVGAAPPPNVSAASAQNIPDPPQQSAVPGPAIAIIPAATTTMFIDQNTLTPREQDKIFQVGTTFYVTYSAKAPRPGNIIVKWYMNGQHYKDDISPLIDPKKKPSINAALPMAYPIPASGIVELYWQDQGKAPQLAQRLYFAVR
ncbi:MAG: hypothetical protein JO215_11245 [Ktedonobacteraceae bacterium]|nr:hypothetical protein [Ktedonobacteraceae bacterium]